MTILREITQKLHTSSELCMLKDLHAEPVEIYSNNKDGKR